MVKMEICMKHQTKQYMMSRLAHLRWKMTTVSLENATVVFLDNNVHRVGGSFSKTCNMICEQSSFMAKVIAWLHEKKSE